MYHLHNKTFEQSSARRYFCFGGGSKVDQTPLPTPAPTPMPSQQANPTQTADARRRQVANLRYGLASTILTGAKGVSGTGADLTPPQQGAKTTLGG